MKSSETKIQANSLKKRVRWRIDVGGGAINNAPLPIHCTVEIASELMGSVHPRDESGESGGGGGGGGGGDRWV